MRSCSRVLCLAALLLCIGCTDGRGGINPGDKVPEIAGSDLSGAPKNLSQFQGKLSLINFWATWCGPCVAELPSLQILHTKFKDRGFQVIGVVVDDTIENVQQVVQQYGITYPILLDTKGVSKRKYGVKGFPESFFVDSEQRVLVVSDPEDGTPQTRIWGPREWDSPRVGSLINSFLK
jgi:thiol-disulfide isomerase/thioredoxin